LRFLSLASIGNRSWDAPFASLIIGFAIDIVGIAFGSMLPVLSSLIRPNRISITFPPVRSGSRWNMPPSMSSGAALALSTILCIRLFGLSMVGRKSLNDAMW